MKNKLCRSVSVRPGSMDLRIDSTDPVLYLCDTEVEETREDSDVKVKTKNRRRESIMKLCACRLLS